MKTARFPTDGMTLTGEAARADMAARRARTLRARLSSRSRTFRALSHAWTWFAEDDNRLGVSYLHYLMALPFMLLGFIGMAGVPGFVIYLLVDKYLL